MISYAFNPALVKRVVLSPTLDAGNRKMRQKHSLTVIHIQSLSFTLVIRGKKRNFGQEAFYHGRFSKKKKKYTLENKNNIFGLAFNL